MESKETKKVRTFIYVTAGLIAACAVIDALFFKMISETGLIGLGICLTAMIVSGTAKKKSVIKLNPKTEKILITSLLVLIVSGILTAIIAA